MFFQASARAAASNMRLLVVRDMFWDMAQFLRALTRPTKKEELFKWARKLYVDDKGMLESLQQIIRDLHQKLEVAKARDKSSRLQCRNQRGLDQ